MNAPALPRSVSLFTGLPVTIGQVALFRERDSDAPFLRELYRSTRTEELAITGWPDTVKRSFCDSQFDLQHAHYLRRHPAGEFLIIRSADIAIGRLYVDGSDSTVHLVDIALLPAWRSLGIGSALLAALRQRAAAIAKTLTLNVLAWNQRAIALYHRFGFVAGHSEGAHLTMHWDGDLN